MEQFTVRKTFKYKLQPTAEQEGKMAFVLRRCCELYNAALEERREAWRMRSVSITVASQSTQLPDIKQARPEYQDIHSQVLQDVLTRLDRAFQAFLMSGSWERSPVIRASSAAAAMTEMGFSPPQAAGFQPRR